MTEWRSLLHVVLMVLACCIAGSPAHADKRVALVVGNSAYQHVSQLPNPANDAAAVSGLLHGLGFMVKEINDAGRHDFRDALAEFSNTAMGADIAIVYYAGHGMEMGSENYLIPVDAELATDLRVRFEAVPLDDVLGALDGVKGLRIVMLDACRNNPFLGAMRVTTANRAVSRGLSRVEPSVGTLISFAAKEGTVAADGTTPHSPYTTALLAHLDQPGIEINKLFRLVRDDVLAATGGGQEPFTYGSTSGLDLFLKPPLPGVATGPAGGSGDETGDASEIAKDFGLAKEIGTAEAWDAFLARHRNEAGSFYVELAKAARQKLVLSVPPAPAVEPADAAGEDSLKSMSSEVFRSKDDLVGGNAKGKVTMVEFFDYNCGYCKRAFPEVMKMIDRDKDLKLVMKEFPILGPGSVYAARAAIASRKQGKYWEYHLAMMAHEGRIDELVADLIAAAKGLDVKKLKADMKADEVGQVIARSMQLADSLKIQGTPAFIIDQTVIPGAVGYDALTAAVRQVRDSGGCKLC